MADDRKRFPRSPQMKVVSHHPWRRGFVALGVLAFGVAGLFLLLVPLLDRRRGPGEASRLFTVIALAMIAYIIVLTVMGYMANPIQ